MVARTPEWCKYAPTQEMRDSANELELFSWLRTLAPDDISFLIFEGDLDEAEAEDLRRAYEFATGGVDA